MNGKDVLVLARTVFGEARGEPMLGKIAVAWTVLNRVAAKSWYGDTVSEVCRKKFQYSCWLENDPNRAKLEAVTLNDKDFQHCMYAALAAGLGHVPDPTSGSRHYHHINIAPDWAEGKSPVCSIGVHKFYNDVQ